MGAKASFIQFNNAIQKSDFRALCSGFLRNLMKIVLAERKAIWVNSAASVAVKSVVKKRIRCLNFSWLIPERKQPLFLLLYK